MSFDPQSPYKLIIYFQDTSCPNWHETFIIPQRTSFSVAVQQSIDTGVISSKARSEIIRVLQTLVLQHTQYPNHNQYESVCEKLVTKYVLLKDTVGCGWVSAMCDELYVQLM